MDPNPSVKILHQLQSSWAWIPNWVDAPLNGEAGRIVSFRRKVSLGNSPSSTVIRLSADTRYKLLVNGSRVCVGPTRGSDRIWYYDTVDLEPYLKKGENVIEIRVIRFFPSLNVGIPYARTQSPGLVLLGQVEKEDISTGKNDTKWEGRQENHIHYPSKSEWDVFLNMYERVQPLSNPDPWVKLQRYKLIGQAGILAPWFLSPRMIPLAEETVAPYECIRHADSDHSIEDWDAFFRGQPIDLHPLTSHRIEVEYNVHTVAFIRLIAKKSLAEGSSVTMTYSEGYELPPTTNGERRKGDRTKREGSILIGPTDVFSFNKTRGDDDVDIYEPLWWKTFRFIIFDIKVGWKPLTLLKFEAAQTNFPMHVNAEWNEPNNPEAKVMWDISLRTLRNCMFDGYIDCPFYEQLQYCEDARSAMLFHYMSCGDDRLARQAIVAFAASVQPDGLVCGRYPAHQTQIITGFALFWVLQVCDHMLHFNDAPFVRQFLSTIDSVLRWFEGKVSEKTGLVSNLPTEYWSFIDWHVDWNGDDEFKDGGVPQTGRKTGTWTYFSMIYVHSLKRVCELLRQINHPALMDEYKQRAERTRQGIRQHCYDGEYFTDTLANSDETGTPKYSQQSQVWGILSGAVTNKELETEGRRIITKSFDPKATRTFAICSFPMLHYAFRAMAKVGLYDDLYHSTWEPWRGMLKNHLTTWQEDDVNARSDCHEWSSLPVWEFTTEVAGLKPLEPGWAKVEFAPRLGLTKELDAKVNLGPRGLASVKWTTKSVHLSLPHPIRVISRMPGGKDEDHGEVKELKFEYKT